VEGSSEKFGRLVGPGLRGELATANFRECPKGEVLRILLPRTRVNKRKEKGQEANVYCTKEPEPPVGRDPGLRPATTEVALSKRVYSPH
jgi:hypothetical protein